MVPVTTAKITTIRTDNVLLAAMTDEEYQVFVATALLNHFREQFGARAVAHDSDHIYWVIGSPEEVERAKIYYGDGNPRYYFEDTE